MSSQTPTAVRRTRAAVARERSRALWRRRFGGALIVLLAVAVAVPLINHGFDHAVRAISLPLRHEDIIREQAREKGLDPSLVAAVIYAESRFVEGRTSSAGAEGLMQLTPETATDIAKRSGGVAFRVEDLATPKVNIAYGSYLLRELLDRYDGDVAAALAAYNAGPGKADEWGGSSLDAKDIPYPETRAYVQKVLDARRQYRETYASELGL